MDRDAMAYDADLIQRLIDEEKITVEQLARKSNLSPKSIYKYLSNVSTLPSEVLRAAFELTRDLRIVRLITGGTPIVTHVVAVVTDCKQGGTGKVGPIPPLDQCMRTGLESVEALAGSLRSLSAVVADGVIDQADDKEIGELVALATQAQSKIALVLAAVETNRKRSVA